MAFDPQLQRRILGRFATGVTVVTTRHGEQLHGMTANAVTSLSLDPPLVLVCFDLGSLTLRAIRGHGAFVVNVLAAPQQHLSRNFARRGLAAAWDGIKHRRGPTGSPRLEDVLAALECTVEHALPGGDHEIIVGRVRHVETSANPSGPLVFFRGGYASLRPARECRISMIEKALLPQGVVNPSRLSWSHRFTSAIQTASTGAISPHGTVTLHVTQATVSELEPPV